MSRDDNGRFIKGESGNPNGRPKKAFAVVDTILDGMNEKHNDTEVRVLLKDRLYGLAIDEGDLNAIKTIINADFKYKELETLSALEERITALEEKLDKC